jgi:short-subunit dehydrogenase
MTRTHGIACRAQAADLGDPAAVQAATSDLEVGLLLAAAGYGTSGAFIDAPLELECDMVDVNCSAMLAMSWHFARRFAARRRGGLVLMSSLLTFHGVPRAANYAATKAGGRWPRA